MNIDHVAINAKDLEEELKFFVEFLELNLLQKWEDKKQAYVGSDTGVVIGIIENKQFDGTQYTMAHLSFGVTVKQFEYWVEKIQKNDVKIVTGPKSQRGGQTILFRTPSLNIVEICFPDARTSINNGAF